MLTKGSAFNDAAVRAILDVLDALIPASLEQTKEATKYVKNHWWESGLPMTGPFPVALRRNFDAFNPVRPWLITDIAVPDRDAQGATLRAAIGRPRNAFVEIPRQYNGQLLHTLGHLEVRNVDSRIMALVPQLAAQGHLKSYADFPAVVAALRQRKRSDTNNNNIDSPGPPVP